MSVRSYENIVNVSEKRPTPGGRKITNQPTDTIRPVHCPRRRGAECETPNFLEMSGADFQREVGDDVDKWADAAMISAEDAGYKIDRDWLRSLLDDAMEAARKGSIREVIKQC